jgi:DNA polymerase-3 subunit epsilon
MSGAARKVRMTLIDFETTGSVDGFASEPWQVGVARFEHGRIVEAEFLDQLIHVGSRPFSPYAPGRHEELRPRLQQAPPLTELWPVLRPWLEGVPLVAHNKATERGILRNLAPLHPGGPWVDTLDLARMAYPGLASHKLEDLVVQLGLKERVDGLCPGRSAHDALYDAIACGTLLEHLLSLDGWRDLSVDDLASARPVRYHRLRKGTRYE